jgi:hypothetical protein
MLSLSRQAACLLSVLGTAWGCSQLMGIEEAHVDPALDSMDNLEGSPTTSSAGGTSSALHTAHGSDTTGSTSSSVGGSQGEAGAASDTGDASSTGGNASSGDAETTTGGVQETLCESYCDDIMEACTGPQLQYRDRAQCLAICGMFPEGKVGQVNENTVACRAKYVGDARYGSGTELEAYCRRGGPGGAGFCGSNCDGYCTLMMQVCSGDDVGVYQYESEADCLEACEAMPSSDVGYSVSNPLIADGNHLECRLFHVASGAMLDAEEHCEHAMGVTLCEAPSSE